MIGIGKAELEVGTWCIEQITGCLEEYGMGVALDTLWDWCLWPGAAPAGVDWANFLSALDALENRGLVMADRDDGGNIKWVVRGPKWRAEKRRRRSVSK